MPGGTRQVLQAPDTAGPPWTLLFLRTFAPWPVMGVASWHLQITFRVTLPLPWRKGICFCPRWLIGNNVFITQGMDTTWVSTSPHLSTGYLVLYSRDRLRILQVFMLSFSLIIPSFSHSFLHFSTSSKAKVGYSFSISLKIVQLNLQVHRSQVLPSPKHQNTNKSIESFATL